MKKVRRILLIVCLMAGTIFGLYLYLTSTNLSSNQFFANTVRQTNDKLVKMIAKDPKTYYLVNKSIISSPYLQEQKKAFIKTYYGHIPSSNPNQDERLLKIFMISQGSQISEK